MGEDDTIVRRIITNDGMINRADDLIPEENDTVQLALKRLPPKEAYDRVFRLRRAFQVPRYSTNQNLLYTSILTKASVLSHINYFRKTNRRNQKM